MGFKQIDTEY